MKRHPMPFFPAVATIMAACCGLLAGCQRAEAPAAHGVIQTKFPGQVTAGGGSSGEVMARTARPETDATYAGGTPGIAGGSGGNTGGAETGGTTQESGQGPSQGVSQPASAGRPGATLQPGDTGGAAAPAENTPLAPASNAAPQGPASRQGVGK
jgi:hypothetical protein